MSGNSIKDKTVAITGATSGIGRQAAEQLALGGANMFLLCRDLEKAAITRDEINAATGRASVEIVELDLASLDSVRRGAQDLLNRCDRLDVLINNAGVMPLRFSLSTDGYEMHIAVNFLGHYLLTRMLLDQLLTAPAARIVHVASIMHRYGSIRFDSFTRPRSVTWPAAYSQSKLANVIFSNELARRYRDSAMTSNAIHPGTVATNIVRAFPSFTPDVMKLFALNPARGGAFITEAASSPLYEGKSGLYISKGKVRTPSADSRDIILGQALWDKAGAICGLSPSC